MRSSNVLIQNVHIIKRTELNNFITIIMIRIYPYIFSLLACIGIALPGYSQVDRNETLIRSALHGLEYEIKAGFSIGGTAPLPLPESQQQRGTASG